MGDGSDDEDEDGIVRMVGVGLTRPTIASTWPRSNLHPEYSLAARAVSCILSHVFSLFEIFCALKSSRWC